MTDDGGIRPYDPSMRHVTREEIQEMDRRAIEEFGIPIETLMENAGLAVAEEAARMAPPGSSVTVVCGRGNNGGDGYVVARDLRERGYDAGLMFVEPEAGDPVDLPHLGAHLNRATAAGTARRDEPTGNLIVDAIFGTGLKRVVAGRAREVVEQINCQRAPVLAIDIPSGLDANTGTPKGVAVRATATVTMGLPKIGFREPDSREYTGRILVADIGFPREWAG